jgi:translation initiation factor IF-3
MIRVSEVRLIDANGRQVGIVPTFEAKRQAREYGLDLVEINPKTRPSICKIMDFGKYKFETIKKEKEEKAKQTHSKTKEIKFHPNTQEHDYSYRLKQAKEFLEAGNKVKAVVTFRGREMHYMDRGQKILDTMKEDLNGLAVVEFNNREEKSLIILFRPI